MAAIVPPPLMKKLKKRKYHKYQGPINIHDMKNLNRCSNAVANGSSK